MNGPSELGMAFGISDRRLRFLAWLAESEDQVVTLAECRNRYGCELTTMTNTSVTYVIGGLVSAGMLVDVSEFGGKCRRYEVAHHDGWRRIRGLDIEPSVISLSARRG